MSPFQDRLKIVTGSLLPRWMQELDPVALTLEASFELQEFQLGEVLGTVSEEEIASGEYEYFYILCQGRVRLLSFDTYKKKEVSTQLLAPEETFGGDRLFCQTVLPYRAVATGLVRAARIPVADLKSWLEKLPALKTNWETAAQQRQRTIFLKTATRLRSLPSSSLKSLAFYLEEKSIAPGEAIEGAAPAKEGHYWLRSGRIWHHSLAIGTDWGYPKATPEAWVAQTDLSLYCLAKHHWEATLEIAPTLGEALTVPWEQSGLNETHSSRAIAPTLAPEQVDKSQSEIEFPKPQRRRQFWQRYPFVEQQSSSDCGPACLATISQYWGKDFSLNHLRELAAVGRSGTSLKNLAKAAEDLGYRSRPVRASLSRLVEQKSPWIAHWEGDHYVVVYWIKGDRVLVADPARGKSVLSRQNFLTGWTGYGLLLEPTEDLYETPNQKRSLGRFLSLLRPYRSLALQIIFLSMLIQIVGVISPLLTQVIIDRVLVSKSQNALNVFVTGALLFGIWGTVLGAVRQYLLRYLSNRINATMISGFINHALQLPLKFFESRRVGDILTRVGENAKIQRFLLGQILLSWLNFVTGFVYLGLMFYYNWKLAMLVLALIPPIAILTLVATPLLRKLSRERFNAVADQSSSLVELMTGISTVKVAAAEQELRWRWEDLLTRQINVQFKGQKFAINLGVVSKLVNALGGAALLWYGASLVINNELTIGQFVAFNMMKGNVIGPVLALAGLWDELQEVFISIERLNDVFDCEREEVAGTALLSLPSIQGDVRFENVTFRYDSEEERNALQSITFEVRAGETIAIVGRSGSGKTTIVKLLEGLYYPTSGTIWIDGHDLRHISLHSLRMQLGVVPQECVLFSGTILENITLYRPEYNLEQAIEAAKLAEAHSFIQAMPLGYSTKVGERGANLSGGQRQRIAIARALLGEPRILILDEATSSLDTESESRFQQNLTRLTRDRTTFIIAHRLSTVRNADRIFVLDRGNLVEQGNHEELMEQRGLYYHLARQQLSL